MSNILTKQWLNTVFDKGDYTCLGHKFNNKTFPVDALLHENTEYVSINAMKKGTTRKIVNVTKLRTFLFESDSDIHGNPISMKEQAANMHRADFPWSTMSSSASKSIHFLLVLDDPLQDRPIYSAYFEAISSVLLKHGILVDRACNEPSRFTRAPFGINTKTELIDKHPNPEDRVQKVLKVASRRSLKEVDEWLEKNGVRVQDFIKIPTNRPINSGQTSNATVDHKFEIIQKNFMGSDQYVQGNKNAYQHKMAWLLFGAGCTKQEILTVFSEKFDKIDERDPVGSAEKASTKCDPIYISTPEEMSAYYKKVDADNSREVMKAGYDRDLPPAVKAQIQAEGPNLYLTIGTEYYKTNPVNGELIPWSKTMFEKIYGGNTLPPLNYNLKGYKPDYLSDVFPRDLAIDRKTRNMFMRPTWKPTPGNWETIKGGLQHGFGDQYELILTYCAILIAFPEAKLPAIWFIGPEDKGKSAVIAIFKYLVGTNHVDKISSAQLESDYNNYLGEKQLVIVEEAGNWKSPEKVLADLKDQITETMQIQVNPKYGKQYKTDVHVKFMFSSNDWEGIPMQGEATRFWVREINERPRNTVANYYQKIEAEMGHFVNYLVEEIVPSLRLDHDGNLDTSRGRLYFSPTDYKTDAKEFARSLARGPIADAIEEKVADFFEKFPEEEECFFDMKSIKEACNWNKKGEPNNKDIKLVMKREWNLETGNALERADSLRWLGNDEQLKPTRKSHWYYLTREQVIGETLFDMKLVNMA
jgi:hypothetical protein